MVLLVKNWNSTNNFCWRRDLWLTTIWIVTCLVQFVVLQFCLVSPVCDCDRLLWEYEKGCFAFHCLFVQSALFLSTLDTTTKCVIITI